MGLLKFTKDYTSSDDGAKLTGTELGVLQADIAAVINGGLSNANVASDAAIVESKVSFDTASGHNHNGSNSRTISSGAFRGFIQGAELEWVATDQVKATSGVMDIAGTLYTRTSYSTTLDLDTNTDWVEGISQRGTSKWAYVYAYNSSGSLWDIKLWLYPPQYADTGTDDSSVKIYRQDSSVWYRCLGAIRLNATGSGNITKFFQSGDMVTCDEISDHKVLTNGAQTSFTSFDCSTAVPAISILCGFYVNTGASLTFYFATTATAATIGGNSNQSTSIAQCDTVMLTAAQACYYKVSGSTIDVWVKYFKLNIR